MIEGGPETRPLAIPNRDQLQFVDRYSRLQARKEQFAKMLQAPDDEVWNFKSTEIAQPLAFRAVVAKKLFARADLALRLEAVEADVDDINAELGRLRRGEIPPVQMPNDPSVDEDGHYMNVVGTQYYVCRLHQPPIIRWQKEL